MEYRKLGRSGLSVPRLSFGTLPMAQKNMPLQEGAFLLRMAFDLKINLFDTAELYGTYPYLREAFNRAESPPPQIVSRSYADTRDGMKISLDKALRETGFEKIDIFMLHQQESALTLKGHDEALRYLIEARDGGSIGAVGISTHHVAAVKAASQNDSIDVIFSVFNDRGVGIQDGTVEEMHEALKAAHDAGKGILVMKALGGGHLIGRAEESLRFCLNSAFVDSVVVGMQNAEELLFNLAIESGKSPPDELRRTLSSQRRSLLIEDCQGCGKCIPACPAGALNATGGKTVVDREKCLLCGYCAFACPEFCIKVV